MAQQPQGKHMEVKHMGDSDKKRRATILKGVFVVLLLVAVGCGGYVLYMNHLEQQRAEEMSATGKPATKVESKGKELPDNPIDFAPLIQENTTRTREPPHPRRVTTRCWRPTVATADT